MGLEKRPGTFFFKRKQKNERADRKKIPDMHVAVLFFLKPDNRID
jgi:hypothetical protein